MLIVIRQGPQVNSLPAAALDILLTAAVFDQQPVLAFSGSGVMHLLQGQEKTVSGLKNISQSLPALELYGVGEILAEEEALTACGLGKHDLLPCVSLISRKALAERLAESDEQVFVC